jgi:hypothetical protein
MTISLANEIIDEAIIEARVKNGWDEDTTYRFLMQISVYAASAAEDYAPEWSKPRETLRGEPVYEKTGPYRDPHDWL